MATGEFVAFVDHDDILSEDALGAIVESLRDDPDIDYLYSDHAMISEDGKVTHLALKPDWSPEFFLSTNYIVHFKVMRRTMVAQIGFSGEASIVQDIGMTCRMIEAGARIRHVPKVLYCWRDHPKSVASGTRAKKAIEHLAMQTYDQHLRRRGIPAVMAWPTYFRERNAGAYKLAFQPIAKPVALLVIDPEDPTAMLRWRHACKSSGWMGRIDVVEVSTRRSSSRSVEQAASVQTAADLVALAASLDVEQLLFVPGSARPLEGEWASELLGYLEVDPLIGAVGGKLLDYDLSIRGGGFRFLDEAEVVAGGKSDSADGYWFNNRIASNVMAVSASFMATRRDLFVALGGLDPQLGAARAGIAYCELVRKEGGRIVYNPWAKLVDPTASVMPVRVEIDDIETDAYYHPDFSRKAVYTND